MVFEEKTVSSERIFNGKIINVRVDKVKMPNGSLATREIVEHPGGVGVVALTDDNEIILVKQFRKPLDKAIYEIPAGKLDCGEGHKECGIRELQEETGMRAGVFEYLGFMYVSPGFTDEMVHVYFATQLYAGETNPDEDEFVDIEKIPFERAVEMVMNNEINDAKSVFGILKCRDRIINNK